MKSLLLNFWKQDFQNLFFDQLCPLTFFCLLCLTANLWKLSCVKEWKAEHSECNCLRFPFFLPVWDLAFSLFIYVCVCVQVCSCVLHALECASPCTHAEARTSLLSHSPLRQALPWPKILDEVGYPASSQDWLAFALQCWSNRHSEHAVFLTWWLRNSDSGRHAFGVFFFSEPILGLSSQWHHTQFRGPFFPKNNAADFAETEEERQEKREAPASWTSLEGSFLSGDVSSSLLSEVPWLQSNLQVLQHEAGCSLLSLLQIDSSAFPSVGNQAPPTHPSAFQLPTL